MVRFPSIHQRKHKIISFRPREPHRPWYVSFPNPNQILTPTTEIGSPQPLKRNFSLLSILGIGFSLTNSWFGISTALVTGINSGGPVLIIYGIIIIALISTCVGISLSELASALPNAGGQYFWARELAPKGYGGFASYVTGWFAWTGSLFTSASVALGLGSAVVGCIQLLHPDLYHPPTSHSQSQPANLSTNQKRNPSLDGPPNLPTPQRPRLPPQLLRPSPPQNRNPNPRHLPPLLHHHHHPHPRLSTNLPTPPPHLLALRKQHRLVLQHHRLHRRSHKPKLGLRLFRQRHAPRRRSPAS